MNKTQQAAFDKWVEAMTKQHRTIAATGTWDGRMPTAYYKACRQINPFRGVSSIVTRDVGYHSSGWWKNPDYEQCLHMSLSFFDPATQSPRPQDHDVAMKIARALFFPNVKLAWIEPPYSATGKTHGVYHYRLFCDAHWQAIKPRGEVYSTELTDAGWKSFSDVQDAVAETGVNPNINQSGVQS
jgi:hypothetical protein